MAAADLESRMDRYQSGIMSDDERAEFEAWIVGNPEAAANLDTDRKMRRGMLLAEQRGWLTTAARAPDPRPKRATGMTLAASLAAMAMVGSLAWWAGEQEGLKHSAQETQLSTTTQVVSLARYRGSNTPDIELALNDIPDHLVLQPDVVTLTCDDGSLALACTDGLAPATPQYLEYELEIVRRVGEQPIWHSDLQSPSPPNPLTFVLRARELEAGDYDLLVRGVSPAHREVVGRYWLKLQPGLE